MSWSEIQNNYVKLLAACDSSKPLGNDWKNFKESVLSLDSVPFHLVLIMEAIKRVQKDRKPDEIGILDHGCGGSKTLLYLLCHGYTNIHGVDVGGPCELWNRLLVEEYGINDKKFHVYDGHKLPLNDLSIDIVYSQQVIEHVYPNCIDDYYSEEGRVLKKGGVMYHEIPHRLAPYDSHTQTWFIHYLPEKLKLYVYKMFGHDPEYIKILLHLRTPGYHKSQIKKYIGPYKDITGKRLSLNVSPSYYDGSIRLRRILQKVVTFPIIGVLFIFCLRNLTMMSVIAHCTSSKPFGQRAA